MSALGLGRVENAFEGAPVRRLGIARVSDRDRSDQLLDPDEVHEPSQISGQHGTRHLGRTFGSVLVMNCVLPMRAFSCAEQTLNYGLPQCLLRSLRTCSCYPNKPTRRSVVPFSARA